MTALNWNRPKPLTPNDIKIHEPSPWHSFQCPVSAEYFGSWENQLDEGANDLDDGSKHHNSPQNINVHTAEIMILEMRMWDLLWKLIIVLFR